MKTAFQYPMSNIQHPISKGNSPWTRRLVPPRAGFTLVEVLAAMAVLVVLVMALTRMFVQATNITRSGTTALMRNSVASTAMETLLQDAEGMMVNERLACYVEADVSDTGANGFGFDEAWFISTSGDQDDDMPYEYFRFYVEESIKTNAQGAPYMRFDLIKARMIFAVADDGRTRPYRFYAMDTNYVRWWESGSLFPSTIWDRQVLADHVVRFDIYCTGWDGTGWMGASAGRHEFDSSRGPGGGEPKNVPPAAFDIYLQVTSPDVAMEAGMALVPGVDAATQLKAREMMIRESSSLFGRAVPITGSAQFNRVTVYGTNNTSYYED
jgi:prepilin-type N-terminal cleavage/methylation domain-containing protein